MKIENSYHGISSDFLTSERFCDKVVGNLL